MIVYVLLKKRGVFMAKYEEIFRRPLKSNNDEQYYSTHYENGVETVKKNTLHI